MLTAISRGKTFHVFAQGHFLTARHAGPLLKRMKEQGGGSVVFKRDVLPEDVFEAARAACD